MADMSPPAAGSLSITGPDVILAAVTWFKLEIVVECYLPLFMFKGTVL